MRKETITCDVCNQIIESKLNYGSLTIMISCNNHLELHQKLNKKEVCIDCLYRITKAIDSVFDRYHAIPEVMEK